MVRRLPGRFGFVDATVARPDVVSPTGYRTIAATRGRFPARFPEREAIQIRGALSDTAPTGGHPNEPAPGVDLAGFDEPPNGAATFGGLSKPPITDPAQSRRSIGDLAVRRTMSTSIGESAE